MLSQELQQRIADLNPSWKRFTENLHLISDECRNDAYRVLVEDMNLTQGRLKELQEEAFRCRDDVTYEVYEDLYKNIESVKNDLLFNLQ